MDLTNMGRQRCHFRGRLTDTSFYGSYGADRDNSANVGATIHDFVVDGERCGDDLTVTRLEVSADTHPYSHCRIGPQRKRRGLSAFLYYQHNR
jgi:hypothetical protein